MKPICYKNTKTTLPGWVNNLHETQQYGYAYETETHFVHFYGKERLYIISAGLTVLEGKNEGTLEEWVVNRFGAVDIEQMVNEVGHTIDAIWRPALFLHDEVLTGLDIDKYEQRSSEQAIRIIVEKLDELLLYIEPSSNGLESFSHKSRELLLISCTEVENQWKMILKKSGAAPINNRNYTTQDYVKLQLVAYLDEFIIELRNYNSVPILKPFDGWDSSAPTRSLEWYDAYNKTKHDRDTDFDSAKLKYVLQAVAANIILYCVRFSPFQLLNDTRTLASIVNQIFELSMNTSNRKSFYIPLLELPPGIRKDLFCYDSYRDKHNVDWIVDPLNV